MRGDFDKYPEVILSDGTYKVNDIHMPLYASIVIDVTMDTQTDCFFLLIKENESSFRDMITVFKKHNRSHDKTVIIITDKDLTKRDISSGNFLATKHDILISINR